MPESLERTISVSSAKQRLVQIENDLKELHAENLLIERYVNRDLVTAIKIVPELSAFLYVN